MTIHLTAAIERFPADADAVATALREALVDLCG